MGSHPGREAIQLPVDWMFPFPTRSTVESEPILIRQLEEDPEAAAIEDEEVERFVAAAYTIRGLNPSLAVPLYRAFGLRISRYSPVNHRRACLMVLRGWRSKQFRDRLCLLIVNSGFGPSPNADRGEVWTEERFLECLDAGLNLLWLIQNRRHLGWEVDGWLESLGTEWQRHYRLWIMMGKLTMRRLVGDLPSASGSNHETLPATLGSALVPPPAERERLTRKLRKQEQRTGALRSGVRHLERTRKQLKEQARRRELEIKQMLSQARGEVAAARSQLRERLAEQERELAAARAGRDREVAALREQAAALRAAFQRKLQALALRPELPVLAGLAVAVPGGGELHRLLAQALGGEYLETHSTRSAALAPVVVADPGGPLPDLIRRLRSAGSQRAVILCDGLYRRRFGRPGIAVGGFLVRWGRSLVHSHGSLVSCGGTAGSLQAEYGALAMALHWLCSGDLTGISEVEIQTDCKAMLRQLETPRRTRRRLGTRQLFRRVESLLARLRFQGVRVRLKWVPRDQVERADRLCDRVYREQTWYRRSHPDACRRALKPFLAKLRLTHQPLGPLRPPSLVEPAFAQVAAGRQSG